MILVAYTIPAFTWFASLFNDSKSTKSKFACLYFLCHFVVESYAFALPIYRLHTYWNDPNPVVPMHPLVRDSSTVYGHITVKWYLIINSCVVFAMMMVTVYVTCYLRLWANISVEYQEMTAEQRERLLEQEMKYSIRPEKPRASNSVTKANSMY